MNVVAAVTRVGRSRSDSDNKPSVVNTDEETGVLCWMDGKVLELSDCTPTFRENMYLYSHPPLDYSTLMGPYVPLICGCFFLE